MAILTPGDLGKSINAQPVGQVLAQVGGKPITEEDVTRFIQAMGRNGQSYNTPKGRAAVLEQLIAQRLFLLDAQRNLYEREPAFKEQLAAVKDQLLMEYAIAKCVQNVRVTEEEVRAYYEAHKDDLQAEESVNASHILVDSEEKANEILADIHDGKISFEDAARQYSSCPSGKQGGSLGDFARGQMVPEFDKAVFDMQEGEITGPVKTQFGYHIIRLNSKNEATPISYSDIRDELYQQVTQAKQQEAYQKKINQLKILYPVDKL
jgi:peptidyl-prolyl cis-trans isomerase C